jgi:hypothetical protein
MAEFGYGKFSKKSGPTSGRGAEISQIRDNVNTTNRKFAKISPKIPIWHQNNSGESGISKCRLLPAVQARMQLATLSPVATHDLLGLADSFSVFTAYYFAQLDNHLDCIQNHSLQSKCSHTSGTCMHDDCWHSEVSSEQGYCD